MNILIKSIDRKTGSSHDFVYEAHCLLDGKYKLKHLLIPNTTYNVNENTNTFNLKENSVTKVVTLTNGNYTASQFAGHLKSRLDAASGGYNTFTVSFSSVTGKLTFSAANPFYFGYDNNKRMMRLLGFEQNYTAATTHVSDAVIDLASPSSLGIEIQETNIDNYENGNTLASGTLYVPLSQQFGFYKILSPDDYLQTLVFNKTRTLTVRVVDTSDNSPINLNGSNFEMLLSKV